MTEQKIREAFEKVKPLTENLSQFMCFRAGYLSLLNDLKMQSAIAKGEVQILYRLPEGIEKP